MKKTPQKIPPLNYDESWKMFITLWLNPAIQYFLPTIYEHIDWNREYIYLEDELEKLTTDDKKRRVDKLIKFNLKNDKKLLLLLHIEIQSHSPQTIAERMFHYGIKLMLKYPGYDLVSFILYIGKEKYKDIHIYQPFQLSKSFQFIGEYYVLAEHSEDELISLNSVIGYALLLTLWINKQKKSGESRVEVLKRFIELLSQKNISIDEIKKLIEIAEILVTLPKEVKPHYEEIKKQKIKYMANIVVTPEREIAFQDTISYLYSTRKTKEDLLNEGKLEGKLEGEQLGLRRGKIEGEQVGLRKGEYQKALETAKKLRAKGMSFEFIQDVTDLSIDEIEKV